MTKTDVTCNGYCNGTATATPLGNPVPIFYTWSNNATTATIVNLCPGTYIVTVVDAVPDTVIDSITIIEPSQLVATTTLITNPSDTGMCDAELSFSITGGTIPYTIEWIDCANDTSMGPVIQPPPYTFCEGVYGIVTVDGNGCVDTSNCVTVTEPPSAIAIIRNQQNQINIYPNPTSGKFTVANATEQIQVFDLFGRLLLRSKKEQIDMSNYPAGMYVWRVGTNRGKVVIE